MKDFLAAMATIFFMAMFIAVAITPAIWYIKWIWG